MCDRSSCVRIINEYKQELRVLKQENKEESKEQQRENEYLKEKLLDVQYWKNFYYYKVRAIFKLD